MGGHEARAHRELTISESSQTDESELKLSHCRGCQQRVSADGLSSITVGHERLLVEVLPLGEIKMCQGADPAQRVCDFLGRLAADVSPVAVQRL
eukprot:757767-Hanusia_phi.AAC.2